MCKNPLASPWSPGLCVTSWDVFLATGSVKGMLKSQPDRMTQQHWMALTSLSVSKARLFNGKSTRSIVMHCCCLFREPKAFSQFSIAIYCSASCLTLHLLWRWLSIAFSKFQKIVNQFLGGHKRQQDNRSLLPVSTFFLEEQRRRATVFSSSCVSLFLI